MEKENLKKIIRDVKAGRLSESRALEALQHLPFRDLGFARIDNHRQLRRGAPEVIFCQGKTPLQTAKIFQAMAGGGLVMATRSSEQHYKAIKRTSPGAVYFREAGIVSSRKPSPSKSDNYIAVVTAGTSDIPVAEEAAVTAELLGSRVQRLWDVGVAGIHRLLDKRELLQQARVVVAVAGMEGALPSVVSGLVSCPLIAVPTSVGYGASFGGITALLAMLNSCSPGVAVVNIDNGFGAGYMAHIIVKGQKQ
jgi:hypothetical protein